MAFCLLYLFYKFAPVAFTESYLQHLTATGRTPVSDYPESGAAHMEDFLSGIGAIMAVIIVLPLFFVFTAGCQRFHFQLLPSRRSIFGFAFRALIVFWLYSIIDSEAVLYFRGAYLPLIISSVAGIVAVLILFIGVDSTHFHGVAGGSSLHSQATENV